MKKVAALLLFLLAASHALADGFSPMPLRQVLLDTDMIIVVVIEGNKTTTTRQDHANGRESYVYTSDIKSKVLSTHLGSFTDTQYNTKYSLTLVKGVWLSIPGSGLEGRMTAGDKVVLMLKNADGGHKLLRAEKCEKLKEVLRLRKELDDEERRIAEAQAKIPNGIYHYSAAAEDQKIRLQDGRRVHLGEKCDFSIVRKELHTRYNLILLTLTLDSAKSKNGVLIVDGKAYGLFDHHWAAEGNTPGAEQQPRLYCSFDDQKDAEAVGMFFGIPTTGAGVRKEDAIRK